MDARTVHLYSTDLWHGTCHYCGVTYVGWARLDGKFYHLPCGHRQTSSDRLAPELLAMALLMADS